MPNDRAETRVSAAGFLPDGRLYLPRESCIGLRSLDLQRGVGGLLNTGGYEVAHFEAVTALLDLLGVAAFAATGALVASRKEMDIVGFALLATVTGIGGGTIRDLLLGLPVFWVAAPLYLVICVAVAGLVFATAHVPASRYRLLLWIDALGLALFAVAGAERALLAGAGPLVAVAMGMITATFGGIIRDVLGAESPVILSREIYATAALAGAAGFVALDLAGLGGDLAALAGIALGFTIRGLALHYGWSLPRYRSRPGRRPEDDARD
jgi:uncharacterized membrane protein YeiH